MAYYMLERDRKATTEIAVVNEQNTDQAKAVARDRFGGEYSEWRIHKKYTTVEELTNAVDDSPYLAVKMTVSSPR